MPLLLTTRKLVRHSLERMFKVNTIVTKHGLSVTLTPELLRDEELLETMLKKFREHSDYPELCGRILRLSRRLKDRE